MCAGLTHDVVRQALEILENLTHRGAAGCDPCTGDGAGVLMQIPHALYAASLATLGTELPPPGDYAIVAIPEEQSVNWQNPEILRKLLAMSEQVTIVANQALTRSLVVKPLR